MSELTEALRNGRQCDEDGVMCIVSRQACHEAADKIDRLERVVREIWESLYGQNMQVANWHQNGELEPMDTFFESNDWGAEKSAKIADTSAEIENAIHHGYASSKVMATEQGHVAEEAFYDADGNMIGYWAYGHYDPAYPFQG